MLVSWPCVCNPYPSVHPSVTVTSRSAVKIAERIELGFLGMGAATFDLFYTVLYKGTSVSSKNKGTPLWNFVPNSGL